MPERKSGQLKSMVYKFMLLAALLAASTVVGYVFRGLGFPETTNVLIYLLAVLLTAWRTSGYVFGIMASFIATFSYNFFFTAPYFTLQVHDPSYLITFAVMMLTAIITSTITSHARKSFQSAQEKESATMAVYKLTNRLSAADNIDEIIKIILDAIEAHFSYTAEYVKVDSKDLPDLCYLRPIPGRAHGKNNGNGLLELKNSNIRLGNNMFADDANWPILGRDSVMGVIRLPKSFALTMTPGQRSLLRSMIESTAMAMERLETSEQNIKNRETAEQERYRANLLRAISHDLRTPLTGMLGTSEMLLSMTGPEDQRHELAEAIHSSAQWLHAMVENILSLTRLQDGRLVLDKQPEAAEEVVEGAVNYISQHAPAHDIKVIMPDELLLVPMDGKLIRQVLINLLDNAIKHTPPEGDIVVTVEAGEHSALFSVLDSGSGIDPADLPNIFQMFYTSKVRPADAHHGIGLGLAICETIVKAHGGRIDVKNRTDRSGAEFRFSLPMEDKA